VKRTVAICVFVIFSSPQFACVSVPREQEFCTAFRSHQVSQEQTAVLRIPRSTFRGYTEIGIVDLSAEPLIALSRRNPSSCQQRQVELLSGHHYVNFRRSWGTYGFISFRSFPGHQYELTIHRPFLYPFIGERTCRIKDVSDGHIISEVNCETSHPDPASRALATDVELWQRAHNLISVHGEDALSVVHMHRHDLMDKALTTAEQTGRSMSVIDYRALSEWNGVAIAIGVLQSHENRASRLFDG